MKYRAEDPEWPERDYFILSKGHGALALYAALCRAGYFDKTELDKFCAQGGMLGSLASNKIPGVEASTGSLGHGLSYAVGIAFACKADKLNNHVYCMLGDGECEEGSVWEALIAAAHYKLNNMTIIVDYNKFQAMDSVKNILSIDNISQRAASFGLDAIEIDGHNFDEIRDAVKRRSPEKPVFVTAHTVKGKGISFMEGVPIWHYRVPDDNEIKIACSELGITVEELGLKRQVYRGVI